MRIDDDALYGRLVDDDGVANGDGVAWKMTYCPFLDDDWLSEELGEIEGVGRPQLEAVLQLQEPFLEVLVPASVGEGAQVYDES